MSEKDRPLLADLKKQVLALGSDLREMAALRWQLARLEVRQTAESGRKAALGFAAAGVASVVALSLGAVCLGDALSGVWGLTRAGWLAIFAAALAAIAATAAALAWRKLMQCKSGMDETLEELREDLVWLRDWTGGGKE